MRRFEAFVGAPAAFWSKVRFASQELRYTDRSNRTVKAYEPAEIVALFRAHDYAIDGDEARDLAEYSRRRRAAILAARALLMDAAEAARAYADVERAIPWETVPFGKPMNKQRGEKRTVAYLTAIVDLLAFDAVNRHGATFDPDPHALLQFHTPGGDLCSVSSRRLDGALPGVVNPVAVWEIKEYYHTTTFGSRIADGVYESRLDGYELREAEAALGAPVEHVLFVDSRCVWWEQGRSYFCRLIDMLNEGSVDEVVFGREVLTAWPALLEELLARL